VLTARGERLTDASCLEADALVGPPLPAGAARALVARSSFWCRLACARLDGTSRAEGGEENQDGSNSLPL
jgi:hypothetical protein